MLHGCVRESGMLGDTFTEYLDRKIEQLDPVERAVLMIGLFEPVCAPWKIEGIPQDFSFGSHRSVGWEGSPSSL